MARFTAQFFRDELGDTSFADQSFDAGDVAAADAKTAELLLTFNQRPAPDIPSEQRPTQAQLTDTLTGETYSYAVEQRAVVKQRFQPGSHPYLALA